MAEKQDLKDAPVKDELQVAASQDTSLRKVELDLDDAPFLVEQAPPPPAKTEEAPLQVAEEGAEPPKKKKKLLIIAAAAGLLEAGDQAQQRALAAAAAPDDGDELTRRHIKVVAAQHLARAEALADVAQLQAHAASGGCLVSHGESPYRWLQR